MHGFLLSRLRQDRVRQVHCGDLPQGTHTLDAIGCAFNPCTAALLIADRSVTHRAQQRGSTVQPSRAAYAAYVRCSCQVTQARSERGERLFEGGSIGGHLQLHHRLRYLLHGITSNGAHPHWLPPANSATRACNRHMSSGTVSTAAAPALRRSARRRAAPEAAQADGRMGRLRPFIARAGGLRHRHHTRTGAPTPPRAAGPLGIMAARPLSEPRPSTSSAAPVPSPVRTRSSARTSALRPR